jgi:signal transduction histidine kinase
VVAAVLLEELRRPVGRPELWPNAEVRITGPQQAIGARIDHPVLTRPVVAGGLAWRVAVGAGPTGRPLTGWIVFASGLLVAAAVHVALRHQHVQRAQAQGEAGTRARQLEIIAGTSASLQQSLDLADLLPAFCVNVTGEFRLTCTSVLVADDDGRFIEAFRFAHDGRRDRGEGEVLTQFGLRRGWRDVGRLQTWSASRLDDVTMQSLQALADLLAVAVSNAHLYHREQQAVSRLSELDALKNAFLGTVSHELRTSITAVQGFGELLTVHWDTLTEDRRRELASRIKRQAGSLRHLVDDLLDYARLEHQSVRVTPRHVSLTDLVLDLAASMSPLVADHDVVVDAASDVAAWADPIAVERILANLLSNAGKYSPAGTTVTVTVEPQGDRARMIVADQGPGIPAEERRRVFVRFYRMSNAETVRTRGAGIGLSVLHDFADGSGAVVTIDDAPGGGARIAVDFPTVATSSGAADGEAAVTGSLAGDRS